MVAGFAVAALLQLQVDVDQTSQSFQVWFAISAGLCVSSSPICSGIPVLRQLRDCRNLRPSLAPTGLRHLCFSRASNPKFEFRILGGLLHSCDGDVQSDVDQHCQAQPHSRLRRGRDHVPGQVPSLSQHVRQSDVYGSLLTIEYAYHMFSAEPSSSSSMQ